VKDTVGTNFCYIRNRIR